MIKVAESDAEIDSCFEAMSLLRPHLKRDEFVAFVRRMEPQGYRLAYLITIRFRPSPAIESSTCCAPDG